MSALAQAVGRWCQREYVRARFVAGKAVDWRVFLSRGTLEMIEAAEACGWWACVPINPVALRFATPGTLSRVAPWVGPADPAPPSAPLVAAIGEFCRLQLAYAEVMRAAGFVSLRCDGAPWRGHVDAVALAVMDAAAAGGLWRAEAPGEAVP
ncbi:MAG TPA: hypothetical protein PKA33_01585 [Amaricoccus sp.]|uniref:hypothetical protein n=1 Tax=Amaricoccus sp. TaxID=1872485 RepID=UPI002B7266CC|nr:hypothetical protein [Amaricoccus sp.]HMR51213.1 hypothetical protein [Amaricoccus sp.]HMT98038.1 hypothetical protein [Amaricoccus sp.]